MNLLADQQTLETLLPDGVCGALAVVDGAAGGVAFDDEDELTGEMSEGRRLEFLKGRDCARTALAGLGLRPTSIARDGRGLPVWPGGFTGSISHCKGLCAAVAARVAAYGMLGLDVERTDRLSPAAMTRVLHPAEIAWAGGDQWRGSLLFSLKEAFYKAQYPCLQIPANFQDLGLKVDLEGGRASCCEASPELAEVADALSERGGFHFACRGNQVVSLCWLRNPASS